MVGISIPWDWVLDSIKRNLAENQHLCSFLPACGCNVASCPPAPAAVPSLSCWEVSLKTLSWNKCFLPEVAFVG